MFIGIAVSFLLVLPLNVSAAPPPPVQVVNVRFAHYPDKLRIVVDCTAKVKFSHNFSSDRKALVISLEDAEWRPPRIQNWKQMAPITGYRYTADSPGSGRFEVLSLQPLRILSLTTLPPDGDNKNFRIVVDLAADDHGTPPAPAPAAAVPPPPPAPAPVAAVPPPPPAPAPAAAVPPPSPPAPAPAAAVPPPPPAPAPAAAVPPPSPPAPAPAAAVPPPPPPAPAPVAAVPPPPPPAPAPAAAVAPPASAPQAPAVGVSSTEVVEEWLNRGAKLALGDAGTTDLAQAMTLFHQAADAGSPLGAFNIAELYRTGKGVPQSFTNAAEWYEKASQKGFAPAEFYLGALLYSGTGVPADQQRALLLLASAASKGYAPAQGALEELKQKAEKPAAPGGQ